MTDAYQRCPQSGKVAYPSKAAARGVMRMFGTRMRAYRCECGKWHTTTHTDGRRR